jgi:hypothetical protein
MTARTPAATSAHTAQPANQRSSMQKPGIAHRRAQARASELAGAERAKTQPAHTAPQPHSIAWEGGGEAAMKGGAPWFCGRASGCGAEGAPKAFTFSFFEVQVRQKGEAILLELGCWNHPRNVWLGWNHPRMIKELSAQLKVHGCHL